jgi:NAD(P)H-hydrate epimerase
VTIFAGSGNNGGDGWVVAECLAERGVQVSVIEFGSPRSPEAMEARSSALVQNVRTIESAERASLVVDALLGTGSSGTPRGEIARAIENIEALRADGAPVVSLDLPSGLDATTGAHEGSVRATSTITFGVIKRGELLAREVCGDITLLDIGLRESETSRLPLLVDDAWVHDRIPAIPNDAHKGTRKRVTIVGGGKGMPGAAVLAGEGALRTGIGLLRIVSDQDSSAAIHAAIPEALGGNWPETAEDLAKLTSASDAFAVGPGLGRSQQTRDLVERILLAWNGPVVLDADALNDFADDSGALAQLLNGRPSVLTPHPAEMGRLVGRDTSEVTAQRFDIGSDLARSTGAAVLLKGVPTVVYAPTGERYVSAAGTAALATGGSGDVLTGMISTLLAQMAGSETTAAAVAACAAFIHGRAAELCRYVRGITLDDVLHALPVAWNEQPRPRETGVITYLEART